MGSASTAAVLRSAPALVGSAPPLPPVAALRSASSPLQPALPARPTGILRPAPNPLQAVSLSRSPFALRPEPSPLRNRRPTVGLSLAALAQPATDARSRTFRLPFLSGSCFAVSQGNNARYSHHTTSNRYAWDFAMPVGTPVVAAAAGRVVALPSAREGHTLSLVLDHGSGIYTLYAHLSALKVRPGARVAAGQLVALSGRDPGQEPHLHYQAFALAPAMTSLPSRFVDDRADADGVPRQRTAYCASGAGTQTGGTTDTPLGAHAFLAQGIGLTVAPPAHVLVLGQTYRVVGTSSRPLGEVVYRLRSANGALLSEQRTRSDWRGRFEFAVTVAAGRSGDAVTQVMFNDFNRMGSPISAILVAPDGRIPPPATKPKP